MAKTHVKPPAPGSANSGCVGMGLSRFKAARRTARQEVAHIVGLPESEIYWMSNVALQHILGLGSPEAQEVVFSRYALQQGMAELALAVLAV